MVRIKVVNNFKVENNDSTRLDFSVVYTGSTENERFFKYTPGGSLSFYSVNPEASKQFEQGKEYYVDFSLAE